MQTLYKTLKIEGSDASEEFRFFIERVYTIVIANPTAVHQPQKPNTRRCYMKNNAEVSISQVCEPCRLRARPEWFNCPEVKKAVGAST